MIATGASPQPLDIVRISASSPPAPGVRSTRRLAKLIDTTTCIGCKACEVACQQWNELPPEQASHPGTYQTSPHLTPRLWNLIRFREHESDTGERGDFGGFGGFHWLMRKDQCMHCAEPGCLEACPAPGAIVQYANGIVDFNQDHCIGCGLCISGCPFDVPKFSEKTKRVYKCTLCVDRAAYGLEPACVKACPTGCLQFGAKDDMLGVGARRVEQLEANGFAHAALYDPDGVGGTSVVTVLAFGNQPELYGLPENPRVPLGVWLWKRPLAWVANLGLATGALAAAVHYLKYGRKEDTEPAGRHDGIVRYGLGERIGHAIGAVSYLHLLLTGLAFWTPGLFWLATVLGGGYVSRLLHPWSGVVFTLVVAWMYGAWRRDMRTTYEDRLWRRATTSYIANRDDDVPPAGRFNFGQKLFFWIMLWSTVALLVSGLFLWFPESLPPWLTGLRSTAVVVHAEASLVTIAAFIAHVYMGVFVVPGSVSAILHGRVSEGWARRHHALWARDVIRQARPPGPA